MVASATIPNPAAAEHTLPPGLHRVLADLLACHGNLAALLRGGHTTEDLLEFTSNPVAMAALDSFVSVSHSLLTIRAAAARQTAIDEFEALNAAADDPIERNRRATSLLRATSSRIIPAPSAAAPRIARAAPTPPAHPHSGSTPSEGASSPAVSREPTPARPDAPFHLPESQIAHPPSQAALTASQPSRSLASSAQPAGQSTPSPQVPGTDEPNRGYPRPGYAAHASPETGSDDHRRPNLAATPGPDRRAGP